MGSRKIMFLPQDLLSELNFRVLTAENRAAIADSDFEWHVERLMEAAFQRGYEDGYMRRLTEEGSRRVADDQLARERAAVSAPTTDTARRAPMPEQTPTDRIGRDDGTGHGPIVQVPAEQVSAMRSIVDANRRALGLPPQTADSDLRPWVMDLDGMWHRRPPGREWHLDRPDGAQAETVCGRWVPSVNVSEYNPCSEGSEWSCPGCAAAVSSAVPGEPTEGGAHDA